MKAIDETSSSVVVGFPVFSLAFLADVAVPRSAKGGDSDDEEKEAEKKEKKTKVDKEAPSPPDAPQLPQRHFLVAGGGGAGRSGVKNKIELYKLNDDDEPEKVAEYSLSREEDAPMSLAAHPKDPSVFVCGANCTEEKIEKGQNSNLRVFKIADKSLKQTKSVSTIRSKSVDDYQKVVAFSPSAEYLAAGISDGELHVLKYKSLEPAFPTHSFGKEEVNDVDFSGNNERVAAISDSHLKIFNLDDGSVAQTINKPILNKKMTCKFRCIRFGRGTNSNYIYAAVNSSDRTRGFICKWDTRTWTLVAKQAVVKKALTSLGVSEDGQLLAFGSQDLAVGVVDADTLRVLKLYPEAHGLPPTAVAFDTESSVLVSASADTSVRVIRLPESLPKGLITTLPPIGALILVLLTILTFAFAMHIYERQGGWAQHATLTEVLRSVMLYVDDIKNITSPWENSVPDEL